jgi:hypothetical protein
LVAVNDLSRAFLDGSPKSARADFEVAHLHDLAGNVIEIFRAEPRYGKRLGRSSSLRCLGRTPRWLCQRAVQLAI